MTPELKSSWLEALRSGRYPQGRGALKSRDLDGSVRYCCLGVLCDLMDPNKWSLTPASLAYKWDGRAGTLPDYVKAELGMREKTGKLVVMNDNGCNTFHEIADYVEKNL